VGEASQNYLMGYIRYVHFASAYLLTVGFLGRIYWAVVGNDHARTLFLPAVWTAEWWDGFLHELRWYAFLEKQPRHHVGHNPMASLAMHVMLVWGTLFMIVTGFAMYGEGEGMGSWQYRWFSSWVIPWLGQSQDVHTWHHLFMWYLVIFIIIHVYGAVRENMLSQPTFIRTMITGWRTVKKDGSSGDRS
jgi:Ni/Fe-hydrogenase 1 B-type cytochrome subunit